MTRLTGGIVGKHTDDPFQRETATQINGRHVTEGTELTVRGLGRVQFRALVTNPRNNAVWLDVVKDKVVRPVALDKVTTVHTKQRTRQG